MYLKQKLLLDFISLGPRTSTFIMDDVPAPSTKLNPILFQNPLLALGKHIREIIGSPPSSIEPLSSHTREAVLRRIRELEDTPGILTPAATNRAMLAGPSHNTGDESVQRPHAILALEDWASRRQQGSADRELLNVRHKKRKLGPSGLKDVWAEWVPMPNGDFAADAPETVVNIVTILGKCKEYASTVDSMSLFRPMKASSWTSCSATRAWEMTSTFLTVLFVKQRLSPVFWTPRVSSSAVTVENSYNTPLHTIQEWNGSFWVNSTLASLGLIYQIGHGGFPCPFPDDAVRNMTVIAAPIIHQIRFQYCKCDKSDDADNLEQLMRNACNLNVRDFIAALQRVTDTTVSSRMTWLPERYKQFQRMARQWSFLKRVEKTKSGQCAVNCWACPHNGCNLPENWCEVDPKYQFLYMLIIAVDTNFRLKNHMRANEIDDPSLGPGWGYWVDPESVDLHCLRRSSSKGHTITTGLQVSGVGGCVCARHECMQPNGLGNLQKGRGFTLLLLTISYAIACQWKANLHPRMEKLPADIHIPLNSIKLQCTLPVWHAASHVEDCQNQNSLTFQEGVGKTDGKGVERTWSRLNPAAYSTKDAGLGQRADTLEGKIDDQNYLKNVGLGDSLQRKLVVAIAERDKQISAFKEVNKTVSREVRASWEGMIEAWVKDDTSTVANLFVLERERYASEIASGWMILMMDPLTDCPTEAEVRLDVRKDEDALNTVGKTPLHGCSAMAFLTMGIQIEDSQRCIIVQLAGTVLVAADCETKIQEWWHALLAKLVKFRNLQAIYMPGAAATIAEAEEAHDAATSPPKPELVQLFMPSDLAALGLADALVACVLGLVEMEAKLCVGQCDNSLASLRSRLHAKRWLIGFCNENVTGQIQATKLGEQVEGYAKRYRKGHSALRALKGKVIHPHLRLLRLEDVQLDGDNEESDAAS
ncbi:hypothetical protein B0H13DRAFT_1903764 [Mycena leptocephala]|nr:hypothetical protein B0H13DRAFT_1903764 [Mycena leptocephala]